MGNDVLQIGGAIVGGVVGLITTGTPMGAFKGASIGYSLGSAFSTVELDEAIGPKKDDLRFTSSAYGVVIPRIYGAKTVAGNVIWMKNNRIKETEHRETVESGGSRGGSSQTRIWYTYSATFAVALTEGPVGGFKRIWADNVLIYDEDSGPELISEYVGGFEFFEGRSDQEVSDTITNSLTPGSSTTNYRGVAYIIFEDLQLESFGDRIPNIQVEVFDEKYLSKSTDFEYSTDFFGAVDNLNYIDASSIFAGANERQWPWDSNRSGTITALLDPRDNAPNETFTSPIEDNDGNITWTKDYPPRYLIKGRANQVAPSLIKFQKLQPLVPSLPNLEYKSSHSGPSGTDNTVRLDTGSPNNLKIYPVTDSPYLLALYTDVDGKVRVMIGTIALEKWIVFTPVENVDGVFDSFSKWGNGTPESDEIQAHYVQGRIIIGDLWQNDDCWVAIATLPENFVATIDELRNTYTIPNVSAVTAKMPTNDSYAYGGDMLSGRFFALTNGTTTGSGTLYEIDPVTATTTGNVTVNYKSQTYSSLWCSFTRPGFAVGYQKESNSGTSPALILHDFDNDVQLVESDNGAPAQNGYPVRAVRLGYSTFWIKSTEDPNTGASAEHGALYSLRKQVTLDSGKSLSSVFNSEIERSPFITADNVDTSALADEDITGYLVSSKGSVSSILQPMREVYFIDPYEEDYKIKFISRENLTSIVTIPKEDLQAHEVGQGQPDQLISTYKLDKKLPGRIEVTYSDFNRDYEDNMQYAERSDTLQSTKQEIQTPLVLTSNEAAQMAEKVLFSATEEARGISSIVTHFKYSYLEAGQLITVETDNETFDLRITEIDKGRPGLVKINGIRDALSNYTSNASGESGEYTSPEATFKSDTELLIMDSAIIRDLDDDYGFYYTMYPESSGGDWGGALLLSSIDGLSWNRSGALFNTPTVGIATSTLSGSMSHTIIDSSETLTVNLVSGEFVSVSESEMRAGENLALYGKPGRWEVIKFQDVVDNGDSTHTLSKFIRGYAGTERLMDDHEGGDYVIIMNESTVARYSTVNDDIYENSRLYGASTIGTVFSAESAQSFIHSAVGKYPPPGYHASARKESNDDITISWIRALRKSWKWKNNSNDPDFDAGRTVNFEVDILDSSDTVLRTLTLTSTSDGLKQVTYTSAQQVTDFGTVQDEIKVRIYEMSSEVGRGWKLERTLNTLTV